MSDVVKAKLKSVFSKQKPALFFFGGGVGVVGERYPDFVNPQKRHPYFANYWMGSSQILLTKIYKIPFNECMTPLHGALIQTKLDER